MKLAILERHPVPSTFAALFGSYGRMVLDLLGSDLAARAFELHEGDYPARVSDFDALVLTGLSPAPGETDAAEVTSLLLEALGRIRVIALGQSHVTLAELLGGASAPHPAPRGLGLEIYDVRQPAEWMEACTSAATFAPRQTVVCRPPADSVILAGSAADPCAFLAYPTRKAISLGSHPEFSADFVRAFVERQAATEGAAPLTPHRLNAITLPHDGKRIGAWIRRFITDANHRDAPDRARSEDLQ